MQSDYPPRFERDTGGTEAEWLMRLPGACRGARIELAAQHARVEIADGGTLQLVWTVLPPRQIALLKMARLRVEFHFDGLDAAARQRFMRYFDLYMQRGGG